MLRDEEGAEEKGEGGREGEREWRFLHRWPGLNRRGKEVCCRRRLAVVCCLELSLILSLPEEQLLFSSFTLKFSSSSGLQMYARDTHTHAQIHVYPYHEKRVHAPLTSDSYACRRLRMQIHIRMHLGVVGAF